MLAFAPLQRMLASIRHTFPIYVTPEDLATFVAMPPHQRLVILGQLHGEQEWYRHRLADDPRATTWSGFAVILSALALVASLNQNEPDDLVPILLTIGAALIFCAFIVGLAQGRANAIRHNVARRAAKLEAFEKAHEALLAGHTVVKTEAQSLAVDAPAMSEGESSVRDGNPRHVEG